MEDVLHPALLGFVPQLLRRIKHQAGQAHLVSHHHQRRLHLLPHPLEPIPVCRSHPGVVPEPVAQQRAVLLVQEPLAAHVPKRHGKVGVQEPLTPACPFADLGGHGGQQMLDVDGAERALRVGEQGGHAVAHGLHKQRRVERHQQLLHHLFACISQRGAHPLRSRTQQVDDGGGSGDGQQRLQKCVDLAVVQRSQLAGVRGDGEALLAAQLTACEAEVDARQLQQRLHRAAAQLGRERRARGAAGHRHEHLRGRGRDEPFSAFLAPVLSRLRPLLLLGLRMMPHGSAHVDIVTAVVNPGGGAPGGGQPVHVEELLRLG
mmetsp:Transcript_34555/g.87164  ORF Transcript_34555/g.87164 Transcript_34555/m.87164 type:complete len:318 (-) Transcript_34555:5738-6691(-)